MLLAVFPRRLIIGVFHGPKYAIEKTFFSFLFIRIGPNFVKYFTIAL